MKDLFKEAVDKLSKENLSPQEMSRIVSSSLPKIYEEVLRDGNYYVIKRNGILEKFDCQKIETSLARASDDIGQPLGSRELKIFCEDVKKEATKDRRILYSWQLRDLLMEKLYKDKYYDILKNYKKGGKGV
ncbi:MAG: hypothetical protein GX079_05675 [Tissierellia bacterium]|nr:hypothetical protein [Tissierellia bacterium]